MSSDRVDRNKEKKTNRHALSGGKTGRRNFHGERGIHGGKAVNGKKGGGGQYNWGASAEYEYDHFQDESDVEDDPWAEGDGNVLPKSSVVKKMAAAASIRRQSEVEANGNDEEPDEPEAKPWHGGARLQALKEKLIRKEMERIKNMAPDRVELLAILDESGTNLPERTIDLLLSWKRSTTY